MIMSYFVSFLQEKKNKQRKIKEREGFIFEGFDEKRCNKYKNKVPQNIIFGNKLWHFELY